MRLQGLEITIATGLLLGSQSLLLSAPLPFLWKDGEMEVEAKWSTDESTINQIIADFSNRSEWKGYSVSTESWKKFVDDYHDNAGSTLSQAQHVLRMRKRFESNAQLSNTASLTSLRQAKSFTIENWTKVQYKSTPVRFGATWFRIERGNCGGPSISGKLPCPEGGGSDALNIVRGIGDGYNHPAIQTGLLAEHPDYDFSTQKRKFSVEDYRFRVLFKKENQQYYEMSLDKMITHTEGKAEELDFEVELELTNIPPSHPDVIELFHLVRMLENEYKPRPTPLTPQTTSKGGIDVKDSGVYYGMMFERNDFNLDGKTDLALTGASWSFVSVAVGAGNGTFHYSEAPADGFPTYSQAGQTLITGDFNRDGRTDLAMVGVSDWQSIPVALASGDSTSNFTFTEVNEIKSEMGEFQQYASRPQAKILPGDYDRDGNTDIAITGVPGWESVPIAFSNGDGTFRLKNIIDDKWKQFAIWAAHATKIVSGDFDGDGRTDIALTGNATWNTLPVAFSQGDGTFIVTNQQISDLPSFPTDATVAGAKVIVGDYNGDGLSDIALLGGSGWNSVKVAYSTDNGRGNPNGTFRVKEFPSDFGTWATSGATIISGEFNGDGRTDLALVGISSWTTLPVALAKEARNGFTIENRSLTMSEFQAWSTSSRIRTGDFDGDGLTDIVLVAVPGHGWNTIPIATATKDGEFTVTNISHSEFASRAQESGAQVLPTEANHGK